MGINERSLNWFSRRMSSISSITPWKLTCPLKRDTFNRKYIFQPLIFRGHVSFPGITAKFSSISWYACRHRSLVPSWATPTKGINLPDAVVALHGAAEQRTMGNLRVLIPQYPLGGSVFPARTLEKKKHTPQKKSVTKMLLKEKFLSTKRWTPEDCGGLGVCSTTKEAY